MSAAPFDQFPFDPERNPSHAELFETAEGKRFQQWVELFDSRARLSTTLEFDYLYESASGSGVEVYVCGYPFDEEEKRGSIHITVVDDNYEFAFGNGKGEDETYAQAIFEQVVSEQPEATETWLRMVRAAQGTKEERAVAKAALSIAPDAVVTQIRATYDHGENPWPHIGYRRQERFAEFAGIITREELFMQLVLQDATGNMYTFMLDDTGNNTLPITMTIEDYETVNERTVAKRQHRDDGDMRTRQPEQQSITREKLAAFCVALETYWHEFRD